MRNFQNITIIGVGLIGGSLAMALKRLGSGLRITGISRRPSLEKAGELGAIDQGYGYESLEEGIREADIIFLCTPIFRIIELLEDVGRYAKGGAIVTDVGSTKARIASVAKEVLPGDIYFIGGHPMVGSEKSGVMASDPFLFQNAIYVLTPGKNVPVEVSDAFSAFVERLGARVVLMGPHTHDMIAATVSHLPQMMAIALVRMVGEMNQQNPLFLRLAAGGFRDLTRIASSPYEIWKDICGTNRTEITCMIDRYITELEKLKGRIGSDKLSEDFRIANITRSAIPKDSKGFLSPLYEIVVVAEDKPGVIAEISATIAQENINIKDIEVLKVREGEGGTIRLAFESEEAADRAVALLSQRGIQARRR
ncbi:MAG TPA: prephenate dehydrogenase [Candidatus Latescibacteria bacterium]|nr:prephenate dehydrogenase [Candidatus Latescibacterota bacterium]